MPAPAFRVRSVNLTAALALVAVAELVLHRVIARVFLPTNAGMWSAPGRSLVGAGPFLLHLAGVLGLLVLIAGLVGMIRRRELFPLSIRFTLVVVGLVFTALALGGIVAGRLPEYLLVHLQTSYGFLAALIALAFLRGSAPTRCKLGVLLLSIPGVLNAGVLFASRMWPGASSGAIAEIVRLSQVVALVALGASPVLLPPRPLGATRLAPALAVAAAAGAILAAALAYNFDLVQAVVLYGLRLELPPPPSPLAFGFGLALCGLCIAVVQLLSVPGGSRLAGYGLLLAASAGYQPIAPQEVVLALAGLLAVAAGVARARPAGATPALRAVPETEWRAYVARLAGAAQTTDPSSAAPPRPEAVVVHDDDVEITRVRLLRNGYPVSLRVRRREGRLAEVEVVVGEPGRGAPDATIEPRLGKLERALGPRAPFPRADTEDPDFDHRFIVHGTAPLEDENLRLHLLQHTAGHIGLWRDRGVRYRAVPGKGSALEHPFGAPPHAPEPALALVDTLAELLAAPG